MDFGAAPHELGLDTRLTEIGAHGEVSDRSDHGDGSGDVVEDSVRAWLGIRQAHEDQSRREHDCADSLNNVSHSVQR